MIDHGVDLRFERRSSLIVDRHLVEPHRIEDAESVVAGGVEQPRLRRAAVVGANQRDPGGSELAESIDGNRVQPERDPLGGFDRLRIPAGWGCWNDDLRSRRSSAGVDADAQQPPGSKTHRPPVSEEGRELARPNLESAPPPARSVRRSIGWIFVGRLAQTGLAAASLASTPWIRHRDPHRC
jgi:hypothetical protein